MVISSKNSLKRNKVVRDSDENGEGINCYFKKWFFLITILFIWLIAGKAFMSTKRTHVVFDIDGDEDDENDENGEGIKYYLNTFLIWT